MGYMEQLDPYIFPFIRYGDYEDRYPTHTVQAFPHAFYKELRDAARGLFHLFCKAAEVFQQAPDDFARTMDMPEAILPYLHTPNPLDLPTWLSRFDFVLDERGKLQLVEINADTPCFVIESFYANGVAAKYAGKRDPNEGSEAQLRIFLKRLHETLCRPVVHLEQGILYRPPFVFSCFDDYPEDLATTRFLQRLMEACVSEADVRFLSFYEMEIDEGGICLPDGTHAGALYRLHPMEILIDEITDAGEPLGSFFLDLYKDGRFALMNPPEAIILQNKSFLALVYALYRTRKFFTDEERELLGRYLVPSYFEDDFGGLADGTYIRKEIWGREGRNVRVVAKEGQSRRMLLEKHADNCEEIVCRESRKAMYQRFIHQPRFSHIVDSGRKTGYVTLSVFMLLDEPSAVGCRFSPEEVAGTEAYFLPLVEE